MALLADQEFTSAPYFWFQVKGQGRPWLRSSACIALFAKSAQKQDPEASPEPCWLLSS